MVPRLIAKHGDVCQPGGKHAWYSTQTLLHMPVESICLGFVIAGGTWSQAELNEIAGAKAGVERLEVDQAAYEEAGADEEK